MPRGRPLKSIVRDRLVEILFVGGKMTAYDAHKHYLNIFGKTTRRNVYYQLQKGADLDIFIIKQVVAEKGNFSWGETTRKVYYTLGKKSSARLNKDVKNYFDSKKSEFRPTKKTGEPNDKKSPKAPLKRKTSLTPT